MNIFDAVHDRIGAEAKADRLCTQRAITSGIRGYIFRIEYRTMELRRRYRRCHDIVSHELDRCKYGTEAMVHGLSTSNCFIQRVCLVV